MRSHFLGLHGFDTFPNHMTQYSGSFFARSAHTTDQTKLITALLARIHEVDDDTLICADHATHLMLLHICFAYVVGIL